MTSAILTNDFHGLEVREPPASCLIVRMANVIPGSWALPTHIANSSHITLVTDYRSNCGFTGMDTA